MRERKKTGVHGTLEMISLAWKFNSKKLLSKTLNSRMNILETSAVLELSRDIDMRNEKTCSKIVFIEEILQFLHYLAFREL